MPTVSVIVPVYNVEPYLQKCIESILSQNFIDFELLLVDDGSTDNSGKICDKYALTDMRVIVYHLKNNRGVGYARNVGIRQTKGKWITFIDSDDYLTNNDYLGDLLNACLNKNVNLCITKGYIKFGENKNVFNVFDDRLSIEYAFEHILGYNEIYLSSWGRLYNASIIKRNNILFPEDFHYAEDCCFNIEYMQYIAYFSVANTMAYYYRENVQSLTHTHRSYHHYLRCLKRLFLFYPIYQKNYGVKSIDDYFIGFHLVGNTLSILYDLYRRSYNYDERKFVIAEICALLQGVKGKYEKYVYSYTNKIKFRLIHMPFFVLNFVFKIQAIWK